MKLKKFLSAALTSAVILTAFASSVSALKDGEATYCFDTDSALTDWATYGSVTETSFEFGSTSEKSKNGSGCLVVSENFTDSAENEFGGAYVEASVLGLDNFKGCTVEMSVLLCEGADGYYSSLSVYSDGLVWLSAPAVSLSTDEWTTVSLQIPENAENTRVGFTIPTFDSYMGKIVYIDDFSIKGADGNIITNRGDYEAKSVIGTETSSKSTNIIFTVVLVVLIIAIVGGIGLIVSSALKKFS